MKMKGHKECKIVCSRKNHHYQQDLNMIPLAQTVHAGLEHSGLKLYWIKNFLPDMSGKNSNFHHQ